MICISVHHSNISPAKLKAHIRDWPHIQKLMEDDIFITKMKKNKNAAWFSFKNFEEHILGDQKSKN